MAHEACRQRGGHVVTCAADATVGSLGRGIASVSSAIANSAKNGERIIISSLAYGVILYFSSFFFSCFFL